MVILWVTRAMDILSIALTVGAVVLAVVKVVGKKGWYAGLRVLVRYLAAEDEGIHRLREMVERKIVEGGKENGRREEEGRDRVSGGVIDSGGGADSAEYRH